VTTDPRAQDSARELQAGGQLGPYTLEAVLGQGATGVVFVAVRRPDGEQVALKVLRRALSGNAAFVQRFLREARVAADVPHGHLVPILEAGEADGRHYLAARYVEGRSLRDRLRADGPMPRRELLRLAAHVGAGLDALHAAGLVHRDVKPSNIMLAADGTALLTDFGLARGPAYSVVTKPGELMGTPAYMAPELISGQEATSASDLYALGCVIFECIGGAPPFASPSLIEMVTARLLNDPPDPCAERPDLPRRLGPVVQQALARDPARRPTTGIALAHLLLFAAR
jgi:serine/threonine-protein kinase